MVIKTKDPLKTSKCSHTGTQERDTANGSDDL